jgi:hypothetical protein
MNGSGVVAIPKLGLFVAVAVVNPPAEEAFVAAPESPVVVAVTAAVVAAATGAPLQYTAKIEDSTNIVEEAAAQHLLIHLNGRNQVSNTANHSMREDSSLY